MQGRFSLTRHNINQILIHADTKIYYNHHRPQQRRTMDINDLDRIVEAIYRLTAATERQSDLIAAAIMSSGLTISEAADQVFDLRIAFQHKPAALKGDRH